jgi:DnaJ-class molecular chaperone
MTDIDYYQILGVEQNADAKQLKNAFRELAFQYHPDRNTGNPEAAEKMKQINEAYAVLSDPQKRKAYDSMKSKFGASAYRRFKTGYSEQDIFSGSDINDIFDEISKAFGFRGVDDVFHDVYGKQYKKFEFKRPGVFVTGFVLSNLFKRPVSTTEKPLFRSVKEKATRFITEKIDGLKLPNHGKDLTDHIRLTPAQAAQGGPYAYFEKKKSRKLVINIPKNIKEGQRIRLAGMGQSGMPGQSPGDLYLKVVFWKPWPQKLQELKKRLIG